MLIPQWTASMQRYEMFFISILVASNATSVDWP